MKVFKVVRVDNYARETRSDQLIVCGTEDACNTIANTLNKDEYKSDSDYYRVYPYDKKLYVFEP